MEIQMKTYMRIQIKKLILAGIGISLLTLGTWGCADKKSYVTRNTDIAETFPLDAKEAEDNPQQAQSNGPYAIFHTTAGEITVILYPDQAPRAVDNFIKLADQGYYDGSLFHYVAKDSIVQTGIPAEGEEESSYGKPFEDEYDDGLHHFYGALAMANSGIDANESQFYFVASQEIPEDKKLVEANMYMNELVREGNEELNEKNQLSKMSEDEVGEFEDALNKKIQSIGTDGVPDSEVRRYQNAVETYMEIGGAYYLDYSHTVFGQVIKGLNVVEGISRVYVDVERKPKKDIVINSVEIIEKP